MGTSIKDTANNYTPETIKNISDLKSVNVDMVLLKETKKNEQGEEYSYSYIEENGIKYRVPNSVLGSLKAILQKKPSLKSFAVSKTGEGKENTRYTVIPLD